MSDRVDQDWAADDANADADADPASDAEEHLLEFLYACPVGLVEIDGAGEVLTMNPHAMKLLLPLAGQRDAGNLFAMLESTAPELRNRYEAHTAERGTVCDGHRVHTGRRGPGGDAEGEPQVLAVTLVRYSPARAIATVADVTAQVVQERRLKQAETWFASLINGINDFAVLAVGCDEVVEAANGAFERQTGHPSRDIVGRRLDRVLATDPGAGTLSLAEQFRTARRDGWCLEESWQHRRGGERYLCQRLITAQLGSDPKTITGYTVVLRDVAVQSNGEAADMRRLLTRDQLTGASNRAAFLQMIEREARRWQEDGHPVSLVMLDIDHFKAINDGHGHPAGDAVLRRVSETCTATLRAHDLFARLGGEEFAAVLPGTAADEALVIAERMRRAVATMQVEVDGRAIPVTASFGCAAAVDADGSADALMKQADGRLYRAKRAGRNRVCGPDDLADAA